ncbi:MAG: prolyl oligopeptidase family serine peptidase [Candidatus Eremiobacteraeota bacterium]|nr:prolyl oligopeptidase family serine peptidase [Candidatus Eremiobacteraeota bacterium]MCW5867568.1 prolyl oligopeptidase family serine peptidase [Candidatus Eremiobacteraeota bacterium]
MSAHPVSGYQTPSPLLAQAVEASRRRSFVLSPQRHHWVLTEYKVLLELCDLSEPEMRLAGLRFHPEWRLCNRDLYYDALSFQDLQGQVRAIEGMPEAPRIRTLNWSPDGRYLAFSHNDELWLAEVASAQARRLAGRLNQVNGTVNFRWLRDSSGLLAQFVPAGQGPAPAAPAVPGSPILQEHAGGRSPSRTFQDLLKNEHDEALFVHYLSSDMVRIDLQGERQVVLADKLFSGFTISPDNRYILYSEILRPFSYQVPMGRFPLRTAVVDFSGREIEVISELALQESTPPDFDAVRPGRRYACWREDEACTVIWLEARDGGDPRQPAEVRDALMQKAVGEEARVFLEVAGRIESLSFGDDDLAIVQEGWWKTRNRRVWRVFPGRGQRELLFEYSSEDDYINPGRPLIQLDDQGRQRLIRSGQSIYLVGAGASAEGERPFLDRFDLVSKTSQRLFHSDAPFYDYPVGLLDTEAHHILLQRESQTRPPNLVLWHDQQARELTEIEPAVPMLTRVGKELIRYQRRDGVELTGTLYLPPDYDGSPLPGLLWAYPSEYKSAARAGQLRDSPYRYIHPSWGGPLFFALLGYAVLDDPSFPVVGEGEEEPNDTYVKQLLDSAEAAIDELERRGVGDRSRMAIGGHSYGAFTAANLLAHSRFFKAAICRSGAYNRTLTPFGFQAEERIYWQARETYQNMSPFHVADQIQDAVLLIHGAEDSNSGTFPLQSERFYQALKGLGARARLCILPLEDHGYRARESVLHCLWEMEQWLERHLAT